ncbi:uncharacterized protein LOC115882681 [Sitophilus oryzae]|uniref:Uncharacterized protein LOC115882681 n=1 Tax=Sitophilus oryzae TaxID=7048 RepID=A0A6J2XZ03_SITOR|nr:uncharacterized protein LOC115882681 [Sitophilus oryzae]
MQKLDLWQFGVQNLTCLSFYFAETKLLCTWNSLGDTPEWFAEEGTMLKRKSKFRNEENDELRSKKSHYTHVSKVDETQSKNIELCLEVEMDDEVRDIMKSPEKCPSALLDVTVIKPKGPDKFTTEKQTLKTNQVRELIAAMNLGNDSRKSLIGKLFGDNAALADKARKREEPKSTEASPRRKKKLALSSKCRQTIMEEPVKLEQGDNPYATDETNSLVYSLYNQKINLPKSSMTPDQQIYTTPKTYDNIRKMFACTNDMKQSNNSKPDQPCMCQNCAIVGILTDSQKKPFATEPMPDPTESKDWKFRRPSRKKSVAFKHNELPSGSLSPDQYNAVLDHLSSRIAELEKRVALQEERAVPKDYFKKIITKLVNHLTKLTHYTTEDKASTYNHRHSKDPQPPYNQFRFSDKQHRFFTNAAFIDHAFKVPAEKELDPKPCTSSEPQRATSEGIWKWGEEILSSGRDFKNKVILLLEGTLQNLKKGYKADGPNRNDDLQAFIEELTSNLAKTLETKSQAPNPVVPLAREKRKTQETKRNETKQSLISKVSKKRGSGVNVAYVNPRMTRWPEESAASFRVDSTDCEVLKDRMNDALKRTHKTHFLKILESTNTRDRYKLWQSIYNRALDNRQNKKDLVTVQIPDPRDRRRMIPIEFTIEDLEKLLTNVKEGNR